MKLGHVHLKVREIASAEQFYSGLLGVKTTERNGEQFLFLSFGAAHHDIALQALGSHAAEPSPHSVGLYHVAFEVDTANELLRAANWLDANRYPYDLIDHRISWALYTADPDGNGIEIYMDRRTSEFGRKSWEGRSLPLTLEQVQAIAAPSLFN